MESREQDVAKAHGNSFDWIFNSTGNRDSVNDPKFTEWLSTDKLGSIYWSEYSLCWTHLSLFTDTTQSPGSQDRASRPSCATSRSTARPEHHFRHGRAIGKLQSPASTFGSADPRTSGLVSGSCGPCCTNCYRSIRKASPRRSLAYGRSCQE